MYFYVELYMKMRENTHKELSDLELPQCAQIRRKGFTLLELMIACSLMVLVFAFVLRSIRLGNSGVENARLTSLATQLIQDEAESVRLLNWTALTELPQSETLPVPDYFSESSLAHVPITLTRSIEDVAGFADMKEITLLAVWNGLNGVTSSRRLMLRYAKDGVYDYYYGVHSE